MNKSLIINADDFGLSHGTNEGIIACYQAGSLSSTTLMVNMPATEEAVSLAKEYPGLGVGLHFNMSCGKSLNQAVKVRSLVDPNGDFHQRAVAEKKAISGRIRSTEVLAELEAQWGFMLDNGLEPTHIDSHQHIHVFPSVFDVLARFSVLNNVPIRIPRPWPPPSSVPFRRHIRIWMLKWLIKRNMNQWDGKLVTNEGFASIFDLQLDSKDITVKKYQEILQAPHYSPLELMVHPANIDAGHAEMTQISEVSQRDFEIFSNKNFGDIARELGYELINYSSLKR